MIILLTIAITIFIVINASAVIIWLCEDDWNTPDIILNISKWILRTELLLIALGVILLISYGISKATICGVTNNDYKGCEAVKEEKDK